MLDKLSDRARKILKIANEEAKRLKSEGVGTEHLLLGILEEGGGVAFKILSQMGGDIKGMKAEIEKLVKPSMPLMQGPTAAVLPWTPRSKRVFELAEEQAAQMFHPVIATEHLLLGIAMENEGLGAQVLMNFDIKTERLRAKIDEVVGTPDGARQKLMEIQKRISMPKLGPCTMKIWIFKDQLLANQLSQGFLMFQGVKVYVSEIIRMEGVPADKQEAIAASIAKECGAFAYLVEPFFPIRR